MFSGATSFNQNIAPWKTDKVTNISVSCFFQIFIRIISFYNFINSTCFLKLPRSIKSCVSGWIIPTFQITLRFSQCFGCLGATLQVQVKSVTQQYANPVNRINL